MITDESITQIAEQLGIATEHIYDVFVAAQPVVAMLQVFCGLFVIACVLIGHYLNKKYEFDDGVLDSVFGIVGFMTSIFLYDIMKCFLLPEYSAIIKLMGMII